MNSRELKWHDDACISERIGRHVLYVAEEGFHESPKYSRKTKKNMHN